MWRRASLLKIRCRAHAHLPLVLLLDHSCKCHRGSLLYLNFLCPSTVIKADGSHVSQQALANPASSQDTPISRSSSLMLHAASYTLT